MGISGSKVITEALLIKVVRLVRSDPDLPEAAKHPLFDNLHE
jgi:hypothetical protein